MKRRRPEFCNNAHKQQNFFDWSIHAQFLPECSTNFNLRGCAKTSTPKDTDFVLKGKVVKILAVDDDPVFQEILISTLRTLGHDDVTNAASAAGALAVVRSQRTPFDCILLDIQMPDMDGVNFCRVLRGLPDYAQVPIVMITSETAKRHIDAAFSAGATDYVTKPLDRLDLMARIGMVERLVEQRLQVMLLTAQASVRNNAYEVQLDFESAIAVPGFERGIEYLALENYLLTLGKKGMLSVSAFGIQIENAGHIFSKASGSQFVDLLGDVGLVISDAVKRDDVLISYAGCGSFVGVTGGDLATASVEMAAIIEIGIADFADFYVSERLPIPRIRVGAMVKSRLFTMESPTRILERAIVQAQKSKEGKRGLWQRVA